MSSTYENCDCFEFHEVKLTSILGLVFTYLLGRILLVPSVFSRQQLNSETSRLRRRSFPFPKEWACRFRRFRRLQFKNEALKPSCQKENTSERESFQSLRSLPAQEAEGFGRPSKLTIFGRQYQKNRILKPTINRRQPAEKRRYQKIRH